MESPSRILEVVAAYDSAIDRADRTPALNTVLDAARFPTLLYQDDGPTEKAIEKAARAIWIEQDWYPEWDHITSKYDRDLQKDVIAEARAVLMALRTIGDGG